jgi:hypothetical protein
MSFSTHVTTLRLLLCALPFIASVRFSPSERASGVNPARLSQPCCNGHGALKFKIFSNILTMRRFQVNLLQAQIKEIQRDILVRYLENISHDEWKN